MTGLIATVMTAVSVMICSGRAAQLVLHYQLIFQFLYLTSIIVVKRSVSESSIQTLTGVIDFMFAKSFAKRTENMK